MKYYKMLENDIKEGKTGVYGNKLLNADNGCVNGCSTGISIYATLAYLAPGVHEDQEGFVVMSGSGYAKVGDKEFKLEPNLSFIAPAGVAHAIKSDDLSNPMKVFWFHAAI